MELKVHMQFSDKPPKVNIFPEATNSHFFLSVVLMPGKSLRSTALDCHWFWEKYLQNKSVRKSSGNEPVDSLIHPSIHEMLIKSLLWTKYFVINFEYKN